MPWVRIVVSKAITGLPEERADCTSELILTRLLGATAEFDFGTSTQ